jgi:hypothetical protein
MIQKLIINITIFLISTVVFSQSCDTLRNYNLSDDLYSFTGDFGHALGHDFINTGTSQVTRWAEPYSVPSPIEVRVIQFVPWKVHDEGGSVVFHIYSDNAGEPGTSQYSQTIPLSSLQENFFSTVDINPGFTVNGDFWVGYELAYNSPQDTFAILGTHKPGGVNYTKFFADGTWQNTNDVYEINNTDPFISAWAVDVMVSNAPDPVASFTSNWSACLSGVFSPNASASQNVDQYDWILGDANPNTVTYNTGSGVSPSISPTQVGNDQGLYLLAYGGCRLSQVGYLVDVFNDVTASVTSSPASCGLNNGSIQISGASGGTGNFVYSINGVNFQTQNSFSNLAPGNYTVYVNSSGDGCQETYSVTVGNIPQELVTVGANQTICDGQTVSISASGNGSIQWFDGSTLVGSTPTLSVSPSSTTVYDAVLTDANGCEDTDQVQVTVNPLPNVSAGSNTSICNGESTTLTASGAATYLWDNSLGSGQSQTVSPTSTSTYTVIGTDANGCQNTSTVEVIVNNLPVVSAGSDQQICDGNNATLAASGAINYVWSNGPTGATQTVSPNTTTTYEVTGTDGNGCENTDEIEIDVLPLDDASFTFNNFCDAVTTNGPTNIATSGGSFAFNPIPSDGASINASTGEISGFVTGNSYSVEYTTNGVCPSSSIETLTVQSTDDASFSFDNICLGNNLALEPYNVATPNGVFDFSVPPSDGATINGVTGEVLNPTVNSVYEIQYTTPTGACQSSSVETVTVYNAPDVVASNDVTICDTDAATISATGADNYTWDNNVGAGASHQVTPSTTITYTVTGEDNATGCLNFDDVIVTVNTLPSILALASSTDICEGEAVTLDAVGGVSYDWDNGLGAGNTHSVTPTTTTTYEVIGQGANGCENSSEITINVNSTPALTITPDSEICEGENITISASGADGYTWDNGLNPVSAHIVSPTTTTTYNVTGENANGCQEQGTVTITVNELPVVNAGDDIEICEGEEITLTAQTNMGTISWNQGVVDGEAFVPTVSATYEVTADNNGCLASDELEVVVNELPSVDAGDDRTACINHEPQSLAGMPSGGDFSGAGVDNNIFDPETAGVGSHEITYTYTDPNGCINTGTFTFVVDGCASLAKEVEQGFVVYPNPASQFVEVKVDEGTEVLSVQLLTMQGKLLITSTNLSGDNEFRVNLSSIATGAYLIKVNTLSQQMIRKIIVQ